MLRRSADRSAGVSNRKEERTRPIALRRPLAAVQQPETTVKPGLDPQRDRSSSRQTFRVIRFSS